MSYEGYVIALCRVGHRSSFNAYEAHSANCRCGAELVWKKQVDQTNCDEPISLAMTVRCSDTTICQESCEDVDGLSYCETCGLWEGARQKPVTADPDAYDDRRRLLHAQPDTQEGTE